MINWNKIQVEFNDQAKVQLNRYFQDLEKIMDDQQLSYRKNEVFQELENHIIDIIRDKRIVKITYAESLQILTELGPPDEYSDFSNLPGIINSIQHQKNSNPNKPIQENADEITLCYNCNTKNDSSSLFCVNCGQNLHQEQSLYIRRNKDSIKQLFMLNPAYFYSLSTILLFLLMLFLAPLNNFQIITGLINILKFNELIVIPLFFIYEVLYLSSTKFEFSTFFYSYLVKYLALALLIFTFSLLNYTNATSFNLGIIIIGFIILCFFPIIATWVIFYSYYSMRLQQLLQNSPSQRDKLRYCLAELGIFVSMYATLFVYNTSGAIDGIVFGLSFLLLVLYLIFDYYTSINFMNHKTTIKKEISF